MAPCAFADDFSLSQILTLARQSDPQYLGTQAKLRAALERSSQASSYVLPQLAIKGGANRTDREYETLGALFPTPVSRTQYNGYNAQLTLSQPLWRHASFIGMSQAHAVVSQSEQEVRAAEQDLLLRLARAWFEAAAAADVQVHADAQRAAASLQWDQLRKASSIDLAASPEVEETRAKFDQAAAERIAAASELQSKLGALEEIVGPLPALAVPTLSPQYVPPSPAHDDVETWMALAEDFSPSVRAARAALDGASAEVSRQRAGHEPTLDLVGSYGINNQGEGNFPGQSGYDIHQKSIGVEINIPLYQGGLVRAKVREAVALRSQAEQELQGALRQARSTAKAAWYAWNASSARHNAAAQTVKSATVALRYASVGAAREVKYQLDVLEAREKLLDAWSKLQQSRYDAVLSWMRVKAVTGQLSDNDFLELQRHYVPRQTETQLLASVAP
jgi:outer membrane protein